MSFLYLTKVVLKIRFLDNPGIAGLCPTGLLSLIFLYLTQVVLKIRALDNPGIAGLGPTGLLPLVFLPGQEFSLKSQNFLQHK